MDPARLPLASEVPPEVTGWVLGGLASLAGFGLALFKLHAYATGPLRDRIAVLEKDVDHLNQELDRRTDALGNETAARFQRMAADLQSMALRLEAIPNTISDKIAQALTPLHLKTDKHGETLAWIKATLGRKHHEDADA